MKALTAAVVGSALLLLPSIPESLVPLHASAPSNPSASAYQGTLSRPLRKSAPTVSNDQLTAVVRQYCTSLSQ